MLQAQQSANEQKGTMGDKFESFREQMQIERDRYARLYQDALDIGRSLEKINTEKPNELISLGAVVLSDFQNLFISAGLGAIKLPEGNFVAVSTASPIYQHLAGKKSGDEFVFRDKKYKIFEVF